MKIGADVARRYASWFERRRWVIVIASIAFAVAAALGSARLHVFADFSYLLPQDVRSVTDLREISKRARVLGTAIVAVEASDPALRRQAAVLLRDRIAKLPLVSNVTLDDRAKRDYGWEHRWLFADLADLQKAKDAIESKIRQAKLEANPLFIGLDDAPDKKSDAADELRERLRKAEAERTESGELVGPDGKLQMMIVRTEFEIGRAHV